MDLGTPRAIFPSSKNPYDLDGVCLEAIRPVVIQAASDPRTLQAMIDSLSEQIALVDVSGIIMMTNKAWVTVASGFHLGAFGVGDNYWDVCRKFATQGYEVGGAVLDVLPEFDAGLRSHFEHTYSIPGPRKERFYKFTLSTVILNDTRFLAVTSYEITDLVALKRRNQALEQETLRIQGEEARRIGRDIHDTTAQNLTVLRLAATRLRKMHRDDQSLELLGVIDNALTHVIDDIRAISFMLHPPSLDQGLVEALRAMSQGFSRRTKLRINFVFSGPGRSWGEHVEQMLFRIAQEALNNVYRHAAATKVEMRLVARSGYLHFILEDDGIGIVPPSDDAPHCPGVGIASMRSRAKELSGRFSIARRKSGTRVMASVPIRRRAHSWFAT